MSNIEAEREALLPCPFCGGEPTWVHHSNYFDGAKLMSLGCCGFGKPGKEDELIAAWNRRALPASTAEPVASDGLCEICHQLGRPCGECENAPQSQPPAESGRASRDEILRTAEVLRQVDTPVQYRDFSSKPQSVEDEREVSEIILPSEAQPREFAIFALETVLQYPDFDCDNESEPRPICALARRAIAALSSPRMAADSLSDEQHNILTIAVWKVLSKEIGADLASPVLAGKCVDALLSRQCSDSTNGAGGQACGGREYCSRHPFCGCGAEPPFPERDHSKPSEQQGVFRKFDVRRIDGSDRSGGKHHGCRYFVLDMDCDAHAPAALRAYADSCSTTHRRLAADLRSEFGRSPIAKTADDSAMLSAAPSPSDARDA